MLTYRDDADSSARLRGFFDPRDLREHGLTDRVITGRGGPEVRQAA